MFNYFYHQRIRKSVATFGALFNNIYVIRKNSAGETISQVRVPLSYGPKRDFIDRIRQTINGEEAERLIALKLPRMSFEITNIAYDSTRQLSKMNYLNINAEKILQPVPYTIGFQLSVYAKSQDDALQVVEQIIPYFNPHYTLTIKPLDDFPEVKEDVPLILNSVSFSDDYEGALESRRSIIYTLDFEMKVNFYNHSGTASGTGNVIRTIYDRFGLMDDSDGTKTHQVKIDLDPLDASADSDYGFTELWSDIED